MGGTSLPLPPALRTFEDLLIDSLFIDNTSAFRQQEFLAVDRDWLLSLYRRYREIPDSLNDDERGLIFAILCIARFVLIRTEMNSSPGFTIQGTSREDITYYHLALAALERWNRQSLTSIRKLSMKEALKWQKLICTFKSSRSVLVVPKIPKPFNGALPGI